MSDGSGDGVPYCMTCGENPDSTDESWSEFVDNHTEESCPAGQPVIAQEGR